MARKRHSDEDVRKLLREIELKLSAGGDVASACCSYGISDATYHSSRKRFGGMGRAQLSELTSLEKENARLKKIVADLELGKLTLKDSLNHLKPRA
ncbi:transposase [Halovulum sp. GXIMD14794]